jgi:hypothetical protein
MRVILAGQMTDAGSSRASAVGAVAAVSCCRVLGFPCVPSKMVKFSGPAACDQDLYSGSWADLGID